MPIKKKVYNVYRVEYKSLEHPKLGIFNDITVQAENKFDARGIAKDRIERQTENCFELIGLKLEKGTEPL